MSETILMGRENTIIAVSRAEWEAELRSAPEAMKARLAFMDDQHHAVRRFVVSELPRRGRAITVAEIADELALPPGRVTEIVAALEKALFFLVRNAGAAVSWAFPVTVDRTPHALTFSSGERCFAA